MRPSTPGRLHRWFAWSRARWLLPTGLFVVLVAAFAPSAAAAGSTLVNGDFNAGMHDWTPVVVSQGTNQGYPIMAVGRQINCFPGDTSNPALSIDVPGGAVGYVQQTVTVGAAPQNLTMLTWGNLTAVTATISVVTPDHVVHVLSTYTPPQLQASVSSCTGKKPTVLTFNLNAYAGQKVAIRLGATSSGYDGTLVNFDDITLGPNTVNAPVATGNGTAAKSAVTSGKATTTTAASPRSTIASALIPIDHAFPLTWRTLLDALITVAAMILITFPAQLFNKTLDENYDEIRTIARKRLPFLVWVRRALRRAGDTSGRNAFVAVMIIGSILGGLNDPTFGFNVKSVESFVAVILAFLAGIGLSATIARIYREKRHLETTAKWHSRPAGLVAAAACMIVSRLAHFEPGYLYGVIAGLAFTAELGTREKGHDVALGSLGTLVLAVVSWAIWTPIGSAISTEAHPLFVLVIADTFFAGLFVSGIIGTVISLLPLKFLPGSALAKWHKGAWAALFAVATFLLIQVMLLPSARTGRLGDAPFVTTIVLFGVFGAASFLFNRYFARRASEKEAGGSGEATPDDGDAAARREQETVLGGSTARPEFGLAEEP